MRWLFGYDQLTFYSTATSRWTPRRRKTLHCDAVRGMRTRTQRRE
jgi:hypothetical protein